MLFLTAIAVQTVVSAWFSCRCRGHPGVLQQRSHRKDPL